MPILFLLDCSDRFIDAARELAEQVPQLRQNLLQQVEIVQKSKRLIFQGDLKGIEENLEKYAKPLLTQAINIAPTPELKEVFQKCLVKDTSTLQELKTSNPNIIRAALLICEMFDFKTKEIDRVTRSKGSKLA